MSTEQPSTGPLSDDELQKHTLHELKPLNAPITLVPYDPGWPKLFEREAERVRSVLGDTVLAIEHVGSTSVPGLTAKPIIDMVLVVPDSADEEAYVPRLEQAGYTLRNREPDWFEHRMLKGPDTNINLHVFTVGASEIDRMVLFRDRLRTSERDRQQYVRAKQRLARRTWRHVQHYADAKAPVIAQILGRANRV